MQDLFSRDSIILHLQKIRADNPHASAEHFQKIAYDSAPSDWRRSDKKLYAVFVKIIEEFVRDIDYLESWDGNFKKSNAKK